MKAAELQFNVKNDLQPKDQCLYLSGRRRTGRSTVMASVFKEQQNQTYFIAVDLQSDPAIYNPFGLKAEIRNQDEKAFDKDLTQRLEKPPSGILIDQSTLSSVKFKALQYVAFNGRALHINFHFGDSAQSFVKGNMLFYSSFNVIFLGAGINLMALKKIHKEWDVDHCFTLEQFQGIYKRITETDYQFLVLKQGKKVQLFRYQANLLIM